MKSTALAAAAVALILASGPAWSAPGGVAGPNPLAPGQIKKDPIVKVKLAGKPTKVPIDKVRPYRPPILKAPEIDASSGATAIALLAGILLLRRESFRSRQS